MATIIFSFSEWLLWVIVFTNIAIDIVTIIHGIGAVVAINIDIFIKLLSLVDKEKCNMVNKVCGMWLIHSVSLLYLGNQRPPTNHRPLPKLSLRLLGQQPKITGRPRNPTQVPLNRFVTLMRYCCKYIAIDNATHTFSVMRSKWLYGNVQKWNCDFGRLKCLWSQTIMWGQHQFVSNKFMHLVCSMTYQHNYSLWILTLQETYDIPSYASPGSST